MITKIIFTLVALLVFIVGNRLTFLITTNPYSGVDLILSLEYAFSGLSAHLLENPFFIDFSSVSFMIGIFFVLLFLMIVLIINVNKSKNYRRGEEHGSGRWGTPKDIKPLVEREKKKETKVGIYNNTILSAREKISLNTRKTDINNNIFVIGDPGSWKTRGLVTPNLLQFNCNPVITDPKGGTLKNTGKAYLDMGFKLKIFNVVNFIRSMKFNPFAYLKDEKDILQLTKNFIANTKGKEAKEDFWVKAEELLFTTLIAYIYYVLEPAKRNFSSLIDLVTLIKPPSEEGQSTEADKLFEKLEEERGKNFFPVVQYKLFKQAAGEAASGILISAATRISPFNIDVVREITSTDEMEFEKFPEEKTALFLIIDDKDTTFNFLVGMLQHTLMNTLCWLADNKYPNESLPIHHRFWCDEFTNIGKWPEFEKLISNVRSRNISIVPIIQVYSQLNDVYGKEKAKSIAGSCATWLFLGGTDEETLKLISTKCGNTTVDRREFNATRGKNGSTNINNSIIKRELIMPDEVEMIGNQNCIVKIKGVYPFKSRKYNLNNHPNYNLLAEAHPDNVFDIERYVAFGDESWTKEVKEMPGIELTEEMIQESLQEIEAFEFVFEEENEFDFLLNPKEKLVG